MKILKIFFVFLFLQFSLNTAMAQFDEPTEYVPFEGPMESEPASNGGPGNPDCDPLGPVDCSCEWHKNNIPECIPIDGGVVALLAAGVGYGIKRVRDNRRKEERES